MSIFKMIFTFFILALIMLGGGYYYFYSMKTIEGDLNVNKIKMVNKLYSYDVYSDFYFSVRSSDNQVIYSELQPIRTEIGYKLLDNKAKLTLNSSTNAKKLVIFENSELTTSGFIQNIINHMRNFEKIFALMIATEDNYYINKSYTHTKKALDKLYGNDNNISLEEQKEFYSEIKNLPIPNMRIKYLKLDQIPNNQRGKLRVAPNKKGKWQPNIVEWNFGQKDKIYLRYVSGDIYSSLDNLDGYIQTRLTKIKHNNRVALNINFDKNKNEVNTVVNDFNGNMYILTFEASSQKSMSKYMNDYLKIVYGIDFIDMKNFDNWFAKEQVKNLKVKNVLVTFGVEHPYGENDQNKLGFQCDKEDEIILKFFDYDKDENIYTYKHDEHQKVCQHESSRDFIGWDIYNDFEKRTYIIGITEEDILVSERIAGLLFLTLDDIVNIQKGKIVKKSIIVENDNEKNYFVMFQKKTDYDRYKSLFERCSACHGSKGEKKALGESKIIQNMSKAEIVKALNGYKDGSYGGSMGGVMKGEVSVLRDSDINSLAEYISSLK